MPRDDLQNRKGPSLRGLFSKFQRSSSPVPSERNTGNHSSNFVFKLFRSKKDQGEEARSDDDRTAATSGEVHGPTTTAVQPLINLSSHGSPATTTSTELPSDSAGGDAHISTTPTIPNQDNRSPPAESVTMPSVSQNPEPATGSVKVDGSKSSARSDEKSSMKANLELTGRALRTLAKRAGAIIDDNPAKIALSLVTALIEIHKVLKDNKDSVARRIASTAGQLEEVREALRDWNPNDKERCSWRNYFEGTLADELLEFERLDDESNFRKFLDHEDEQQRIKDAFERINEARVRFELALGLRIFKKIYEVDEMISALFFDRLKPSDIAHHDYILEGTEGHLLQRRDCAPGTRTRILDGIMTWAKDTSPGCPNIYWLFGHAGSGKTTIAYTIARRFEFTGKSDDAIVLGGDFFCSRQFDQTQLSKHIIPTIVYHLAHKCRPFADALRRSGRLTTIPQNRRTQLNNLLFEPWLESRNARDADSSAPQSYLVVIDALDEIVGRGGSDFLRDLVDVVNACNKENLSGLKFFVTSRADPGLVAHVESLKQKQLYHLQDVKPDEAHADIITYLNDSLPHFKGRPETKRLAEQANGLFIYAATVVKLLRHCKGKEEQAMLSELLGYIPAGDPASDLRSTMQTEEALLNRLYNGILRETFGELNSNASSLQIKQREYRLSLLLTFLCAKEPISTSTATDLLDGGSGESDAVACDVLGHLHSVLYISKQGVVLPYHKSFPDFMFDSKRSGDFWRDIAAHHRLLTSCCFRAMRRLKFNIANIPSSFIFDEDNDSLAGEVKQNISDALSYSCRNWDYHLLAARKTSYDELLQTLAEFLQLRVLFWIEAMTLLKLRGTCYLMLRTAHDWVSGLPVKNVALAEQLAEAAAFALYFSGSTASLSTPHLYISAVATWHGKSEIFHGWRTNFSRIPHFVNGQIRRVLMTLSVGSVVTGVAFSSDGSRIVSGSADKTVRIWDASTGEEMHVLRGHTYHVNCVAFSSNGSHIVSGSDDKTIRIWDASSGEGVHVLRGHTYHVSSVAFSSDGNRIVSGSWDVTIRIWDASRGKEMHVLQGHTHSVHSVSFSCDGNYIVSGSADKTVRIWDASTGEGMRVLQGHTDYVNSVAFSSDGSRIVSGSNDKTVRIWDASSGEGLYVLPGHTDSIHSVAFGSEGSLILSGSQDKTIRIWDASSAEEIYVLHGHTNSISSIAFSGDGSRIVSGSWDETIRIWDASRGEEMRVLQGHTHWVHSVAFSTNGTYIVSGSWDKTVRIWDASTGQEIHVLQGHTDSSGPVAFSSNGDRIVSGSADKTVRIWDTSTGQQMQVLQGHTDWVSSVAFSSDGSRIVSSSHDKTIRIWDASIGEEMHVLRGHTDSISSIAFSSDGRRIVSSSRDRTIRIWDASRGEEIYVLQGHTDVVNSVAFSSDGSRIVSGSDDKRICIWDASTGKAMHVLRGHTDWINSVAFSRDGSRIVSGSDDKTIRIWDASTGKEMHVLRGHTDDVNSVSFSSDGSCIVSGSDDETIRIWDVLTPRRQAYRYVRQQVSNSSSDDSNVYTGWLLSSTQDHLMFVPPEKNLPDAANVLTIPRFLVPHIDFTNAALGLEWAKCYSPQHLD